MAISARNDSTNHYDSRHAHHHYTRWYRLLPHYLAIHRRCSATFTAQKRHYDSPCSAYSSWRLRSRCALSTLIAIDGTVDQQSSHCDTDQRRRSSTNARIGFDAVEKDNGYLTTLL